MNTILLEPSDVLFFRDGRPMSGSSVGHGAAWPLPTVTNAALHAALWRAGLAREAHTHARTVQGERQTSTERFGSLATVGPFPVRADGDEETWLFPRPLDAMVCLPEEHAHAEGGGKQGENPKELKRGSIRTTASPQPLLEGSCSSLPLPLHAAATGPPSKEESAPWWSREAWQAYLDGKTDSASQATNQCAFDRCFSEPEATIGIGIDPETGTQDQTRLYSAHYLRLRPDWKLGLFAAMAEKTEVRGERIDLVQKLLEEHGSILVGGQQRTCSTTRKPSGGNLPLPIGRADNFAQCDLALPDCDSSFPRFLVKWILLSPAVYPAISAGEKDGRAILPHRGGWLPNWISDGEGYRVLLRRPIEARNPAEESRAAYRERVRTAPSIAARLVAATVGKPVPVTGWSLGTPDLESEDGHARRGGAKPTHLAVPAGSVYYFACDSADDATALAAALNWHGKVEASVTAASSPFSTIRNRRSTLFGEKGFGLGVCGTWEYCPPGETP